MTAAHYRESATFTKSDMEEVRSFVLYALSCRSLMYCAATYRTMDGEHFSTGCSTEKLITGIDFNSMFGKLGIARRERLLGWSLGVLPFFRMPLTEQAMLRQDLLRLRDMLVSGGYSHLVGGLDPRVAS